MGWFFGFGHFGALQTGRKSFSFVANTTTFHKQPTRSNMDRTSFLGQTVPVEVRSIVTPLAQLDQKIFRKILEFVVENLKGEEITNAHLTELQRATDAQTASLIPTFFSGLHCKQT
jgi:hypothetical protein